AATRVYSCFNICFCPGSTRSTASTKSPGTINSRTSSTASELPSPRFPLNNQKQKNKQNKKPLSLHILSVYSLRSTN
uniref:Uncharacterized protein n=1 Tax=Ciona intestinalis TaxID=7719 RepID=F7BFN5_CIOIN